MKPLKFKVAITYGTFDLFHVGHVRLLRRISEISEKVIVGCSTDEFNAIKGKKVIVPFLERVETLNACKYVSHVIAERSWEQKLADIHKFNANVFVMGSDWEGKFDHLFSACEVVYLARTEGVSSTELKARAVRTAVA